MGLFDLLSREGRARSALASNIKRVLNKHAQPEDRFAALEKLRTIGSDEALFGLARRFSYVYDKLSVDEQEKEWVCETLVAAGERALAPVRRYGLAADTLSYPLRVLEKIAPREALLAFVDEILGREEPGYTRDPTKKIQILTWLGEWKGASDREIARRVVPYLADFDETVRFSAVETLAHHKDESALGPLLDALLRPEEESRRIKVRIAEVLADGGWTVTERKEAVGRLLQEDLPEFGMQHDKLVRAKKDRR